MHVRVMVTPFVWESEIKTVHGSRSTLHGLHVARRTLVYLLKNADKFLVLPFAASQLKKQLSRQPFLPAEVRNGRREGAVSRPAPSTGHRGCPTHFR